MNARTMEDMFRILEERVEIGAVMTTPVQRRLLWTVFLTGGAAAVNLIGQAVRTRSAAEQTAAIDRLIAEILLELQGAAEQAGAMDS